MPVDDANDLHDVDDAGSSTIPRPFLRRQPN